jgi:hypothetical protein
MTNGLTAKNPKETTLKEHIPCFCNGETNIQLRHRRKLFLPRNNFPVFNFFFHTGRSSLFFSTSPHSNLKNRMWNAAMTYTNNMIPVIFFNLSTLTSTPDVICSCYFSMCICLQFIIGCIFCFPYYLCDWPYSSASTIIIKTFITIIMTTMMAVAMIWRWRWWWWRWQWRWCSFCVYWV